MCPPVHFSCINIIHRNPKKDPIYVGMLLSNRTQCKSVPLDARREVNHVPNVRTHQ